jgi:hypothetical protein
MSLSGIDESAQQTVGTSKLSFGKNCVLQDMSSINENGSRQPASTAGGRPRTPTPSRELAPKFGAICLGKGGVNRQSAAQSVQSGPFTSSSLSTSNFKLTEEMWRRNTRCSAAPSKSAVLTPSRLTVVRHPPLIRGSGTGIMCVFKQCSKCTGAKSSYGADMAMDTDDQRTVMLPSLSQVGATNLPSTRLVDTVR